MKKLYQPLIDFARQGWWQKLLVATVLLAGIGTADHYLGDGNGLSTILEQMDHDVETPEVSPTTL